MNAQHPKDSTTFVVLLVDDDPDILSLCAELLQWSGHTVETAADGVLALQALSAKRFEAAVLDVDMPGKSGIDVAREMREEGAAMDCAIVMHTATSRDDVDASFTGYDAFVAKPCFGNELACALSDAVSARRAMQASRN